MAIEDVNPHELAGNANEPQRFVVKVHNLSGKEIRGMKLLAAYYDATEDVHVIPAAWNSTREIKADASKSLRWDNYTYSNTVFVGWIVVPQKILFEDGTKWKYDPSVLACYGEYWGNKKHPRLTGLPDELLKKALNGEE